MLVLFTSVIFSVSGQGFSYPVLKRTAPYPDELTPKGWTVLASAKGDLNADRTQDLVLVLQHSDSILSVDDNGDSTIYQPRMLAIYFYDKKRNQYSFVQQSVSFILVHDDPYMDEPFQGISIDNQVLQMDFYSWYSMGSWEMSTTSYKFRYQGGGFQLIGAEDKQVNRASGEITARSFNFLTRKLKTSTGVISSDVMKSTWSNFTLKEFKTLETFQKPHTWDEFDL